MNLIRGLKRLWTAVSILCVLFILGILNKQILDDPVESLSILIMPVLLAWVLLYTGLWVASGFKRDK